LIAFQSIGFFAGVILSSNLTKFISRRKVIIIATVLIGVSQVIFSLLLPWPFWLITAIVAVLGFGIIEPLVGALIIDAAKEKQAVACSKLEVFFGLGSLIMPLISGWLAVTDLWRYSFLVLGIYSFTICFLWMKSSFGKLNKHVESVQSEKRQT